MTTCEEYKEKCDDIIRFMTHKNKKFDLTFVENVKSFIQEHDHITEKQESAIDSIYTKWKVRK